MSEDPRCCGSGTCIIDPEGRCWCGQQWDGERLRLTGSCSQSVATDLEPQVEDKDAR
jgi:hypothetical protein